MDDDQHKRCTVCLMVKPLGEFHRDRNLKSGFRGHCRVCQSNYYRRWYEQNGRERYDANAAKKRKSVARHRLRYPEKARARWLIQQRLARGTLTRQPCEVCGDPKTDAHHDDYSKPLDVRWLCRAHHAELHRRSA
jgi:hypothetical protein